MIACVMFDKVDIINQLNEKIPNFFNASSSELNLPFMIVAAMYSSDTTFNFLIDTVNHSKMTF